MNLMQQYVAAGLLQFGRFQQPDGTFSPLSLNFLLLPSFPALMQATAQAFVPLVQKTGANRLLALRSTTALGAVLAVESGIPLTYHYGEMRGVSNAFIIEGAYDVGHPTALLAYTVGDDVGQILEPARMVGLNVTDVLCLFTIGEAGLKNLQAQQIGVHSLFDLQEALTALVAAGVLPLPMFHHLQAWRAML